MSQISEIIPELPTNYDQPTLKGWRPWSVNVVHQARQYTHDDRQGPAYDQILTSNQNKEITQFQLDIYSLPDDKLEKLATALQEMEDSLNILQRLSYTLHAL